MSAHNDERRETGADEQEHGRPEKPNRSRRWAFLTLALPIALLAWSCAPKASLPVTPTSELAIGDAVIAVQLGEAQSQSGLESPIQNNLVALVDMQGEQDIVRIGNQWEGRILWSDRGISFGADQWEYQTTENGTSSQEIKDWRASNVQRYELSDGRFIVVSYSSDLGYRVDTIELDGSVTSVSTPGTRGDMGQCGDRILAITGTKQSPGISAAAFAAYAARSGDEKPPTTLAAVVQLNDHDGEESPVLAVAPMIDGLGSRQHMFACEGDVITMPTELSDEAADSSHGSTSERQRTVVLERWDLSTGERSIIPVLDEAGNPLELNDEQGVSEYEAICVGNEYRFVSWGGDAFAVDPASGQGRYLFSLDTPTYGPDGYLATFQVTETGVYALKDRRSDRVVTLSYRPWEGGEWRDIFTTRDLAYYLNEGYISGALDIQSFALRPGWDGGAQ